VFGGYSFNDLGVSFNRGDGTFAPAARWDVTNNPWSIALRDLNGDGHLDIATAVTGASGNNSVNVFSLRCEWARPTRGLGERARHMGDEREDPGGTDFTPYLPRTSQAAAIE
jgi:hypothetical protein